MLFLSVHLKQIIVYRFLPLFKSSHYTTLHLQNTCVNTCFHELIEVQRGYLFYVKGWKAKIAVSVCLAASHYRSSLRLQERELGHQAPPPGTTLRIPAASCVSSELCLWASELYLDFFCASLSKLWCKVSEEPKRLFLESGNTQKLSI